MTLKIDKKILFLIIIVIVLLVIGIFIDNQKKDKSKLLENKNKINKSESFLETKIDRINFSLFFAGDLMLDRYNRTVIEKEGIPSIIREIGKIFKSYDLRVVNLEGTVTDNNSISVETEIGQPGHMKFTFKKEDSFNFLRACDFDLINIGNNHILDFGKNGLQQTKEFLEEKQINYFGDPYKKDNYIIREIRGEKIAFINYNQFFGPISKEVISLIKEIKPKTDFIVIYAHWGEEYHIVENEFQRETAHSFIDNGADLIVGSHPHVIQPVEIYKNKVVFYSLGNFFFDQYFSEEVKEMLTVGVFVNDKQAVFYLNPIYSENQKIVLPEKSKRIKILNQIADNSKVDKEIKNKIKQGEFFISR